MPFQLGYEHLQLSYMDALGFVQAHQQSILSLPPLETKALHMHSPAQRLEFVHLPKPSHFKAALLRVEI